MKIETRIGPMEIAGEPVLPTEADQVIVSNHPFFSNLVVIEFHGINVTVLVRELRQAITNAANHS